MIGLCGKVWAVVTASNRLRVTVKRTRAEHQQRNPIILRLHPWALGDWKCLFRSGSGTERAQAGSPSYLQAAFADINIAKGRSVYYWLGVKYERATSFYSKSTFCSGSPSCW